MPALPSIPYDGIKQETGRPHFLLNPHPHTVKKKVDLTQKNKATYHIHFFKLTQLATTT